MQMMQEEAAAQQYAQDQAQAQQQMQQDIPEEESKSAVQRMKLL